MRNEILNIINKLGIKEAGKFIIKYYQRKMKKNLFKYQKCLINKKKVNLKFIIFIIEVINKKFTNIIEL